MSGDDKAAEAAAAFGLSFDSASSLYHYAPVHRISHGNCDWVLKRTGYPHSGASAIANWLAELNSRGLPIVVPAQEFAPNPRKLSGDDGPFEWVVYPFIEGHPYSGAIEEILAAGHLLGRLHYEGSDLGDGMMTKPILPFKDGEQIRLRVEEANAAIAKFAPDFTGHWKDTSAKYLSYYEALEARLATVSLPLAACPWDYKASGLIYRSPDQPFLVDPDHAGRIPRLFDLAIALLLFHCDLSTAPPRLFTVSEWKLFLSTYAKQIALTDEERACWPDVLTAAWADQAVWLLANWPKGWEDDLIRAYLLDLALVDLSVYGLDL